MVQDQDRPAVESRNLVFGLLLPFAYIIFFILNNSKRYLGSDKFTGLKALVWNPGMLAALLASIASVCYYLYLHGAELIGSG